MTASIDFYILNSAEPHGRLLIACRLSEKAWLAGYRTLILTESIAQKQNLDDLLWTFRPGSFVPHAIETNSNDSKVPVILADALGTRSDINLVINLRSAAVDSPQNIERIIEIVDQDEQVRRAGRLRYRYYQEFGLPLKTHRISI